MIIEKTLKLTSNLDVTMRPKREHSSAHDQPKLPGRKGSLKDERVNLFIIGFISVQQIFRITIFYFDFEANGVGIWIFYFSFAHSPVDKNNSVQRDRYHGKRERDNYCHTEKTRSYVFFFLFRLTQFQFSTREQSLIRCNGKIE